MRDLVGEALGSAFRGWRRQAYVTASGESCPWLTLKPVDDYLSEAHRDHPGTGCAISALGEDWTQQQANPRSPDRRDPKCLAADCRFDPGLGRVTREIERNFNL